MKSFHSVLLFAIVFPVCAASQQAWDAMDIIDGSNPTLRYGFYTEPSGQLNMGRYYFIDDGNTLRVRLAPFGKAAVELPVHDYDRDQGALELGWEGKPDRRCRLQRQSDKLFLGNCTEHLAVMPIAIRVVDDFDAEWQGAYFPVTDVDLLIVEKVIQILKSQDRRNVNGDRNCDDDSTTGQFSLFCALYVSSIEITGVYRHRRPAMNAARDGLRSRFPGDYAHTLRDINNDISITDGELIEVLDQVYASLQRQLGAIWNKELI